MLESAFGIIFTAAIWGVTDPLMKKFSCHPGSVDHWITRAIPFLSNWRYAASFALNQVGSVTFLWTLNRCSLSLAVPMTNSLKFCITFLTGQALGESYITKRGLIGVVLVIIGITLQVLNNVSGGSHHQ